MLNQEDDTSYSRQRQSPGYNARQRETEELGVFEYILMGVCGALFLALVIVVVALIMPRILSGASFQFSTQNLLSLIILMVIYTVCVGGGFLWGRYQSKTVASNENAQLRNEITRLKYDIDRLERDNANMQNQLRAAQIATPALTSAHGGVLVTQPRPIEQVQPPPSIYDNPREPDDTSDLVDHPHEKIFPAWQEESSLRYGWRVIGASRRGYGHAYEGKYREDDFNVKIFGASGRGTKHNQSPDMAVVAIADGVSSKNLSRRGARAAVLGATDLPEQRLDVLKSFLSMNATYEQCRTEAYYILMDTFKSAQDHVERCAQYYKLTVDELQSTLMVFLVAPWDEYQMLVASTQIGDGALFVLQPNQGPAPQNNWDWLQQPQIGGAGNEVRPFMRTGPEEWKNFYRFNLIDKATCILGMTDGTADDIEPPRATLENPNPDPFLLVDDFYQRIIVPSFTHTQPGKALVNLLGYKKKQSHDDRTVVCVYR